MESSIKKHTVVISGHNTSITLEDEFWEELKRIARARGVTVKALVEAIEHDSCPGNLSSAVRVFILEHCRAGGDTHRR